MTKRNPTHWNSSILFLDGYLNTRTIQRLSMLLKGTLVARGTV